MPPKDAAPPGGGGGGEGGGRDRLSALRGRVLVRILSHLRAWEAVRACALSARWRDLWAYVPRLDVRQPCCRPYPAPGPARAAAAFAAFVNGLLLGRRQLAPLDSLRLGWSHEPPRGGDAGLWVAFAVRRGAREVDLSAAHHHAYPTPEYTSFLVAPVDGVTSHLRILKLTHVNLEGAILAQLGSRCTCLEELELRDCLVPDATETRSAVLKRLTMIQCQIPNGFLVYAPNLVSMRCSRPLGYFPWIEDLGSPGMVNPIAHQTPDWYPEYTAPVSCNLNILKLSHAHLDDAALGRLFSRCPALEELELKDCWVEGKEIGSTSLKCLTMITCKFTTGSRVHAPNLVLLCCIKPFLQVPQFQKMQFLVKAAIVLDDSCLLSDHQWLQREDDKDESDHDGDFFAIAAPEHSEDSSGSESDQDEEDEFGQDEEDEPDQDEEDVPDHNEEDEPDNGGDLFAHPGAGPADNKHNESDESSKYYDSDRSPSSDEEDSTVGYCEIAQDQRYKPYKYLVNGHTRSADQPLDSSYGKSGSKVSINCGSGGMLSSLSNVKKMDLLAHSGEALLTRASRSCIEFKNLTALSLGEWCITPRFDVLATILGHSPNLENLFLHLDMGYSSRVGFDPRASSFTSANLKMVNITCCKHDVMVHTLAELFSRNGIPHEKIYVHRSACSGCQG